MSLFFASYQGRFSLRSLGSWMVRKMIWSVAVSKTNNNANRRCNNFLLLSSFFFVFYCLRRSRVIASIENHQSERSARGTLELLTIRWKSRKQISRNQFRAYRIFIPERYENWIVRLMVLFRLVAPSDFIFPLENWLNPAVLLAAVTIFLSRIARIDRYISQTSRHLNNIQFRS